jgi:hypothetical protein
VKAKKTHERNTSGLAAHAKQKASNTHAIVMSAIDRLVARNQAINFNVVAKEAGTSKSYLYNEPGLKKRIELLRNEQGGPRPRLAPGASQDRSRTDKGKDMLIEAKTRRIRELEAENKELKDEVARWRGKWYEKL